MTISICGFVMTQDQADDINLVDIGWKTCRAVVDELDTSSDALSEALDEAQGKARDLEQTQYILIRVS